MKITLSCSLKTGGFSSANRYTDFPHTPPPSSNALQYLSLSFFLILHDNVETHTEAQVWQMSQLCVKRQNSEAASSVKVGFFQWQKKYLLLFFPGFRSKFEKVLNENRCQTFGSKSFKGGYVGFLERL